MNDFVRDNDWQRSVRDAILGPQFYRRIAAGGRYVFLDKGNIALLLQKRAAVDTILQGTAGAAVAIEEKIVRWPGYHYSAYCLETESCTVPGRESPGWMHYGRSDYLLYAFCQEDGSLDAHLMPFGPLKEWFWPRVETFPTFGPLSTLNRTRGRLVALDAVAQALEVQRYRLAPDPGRLIVEF